MLPLLPPEPIENRIYVFRGQKVMLDRDLARLYGAKTMALNQAVRRNFERFPENFMFQLTKEETNLISQIVISTWGGSRKPPYAFTEHGIAMLSGILKSKRAIAINIQIINAFIALRDMALDHSDLRLRIDFLEQQYDKQFKIVFDALRQTINDDSKKGEIGFREKEWATLSLYAIWSSCECGGRIVEVGAGGEGAWV